MNLLDYHPSIFHDYHCSILRNSFPPVRYAPVHSDWVPVRLVTQSFWGTQSDWVPQKDWDPVGLGTSEGLGSSPTGYLRRTGIQSDWVPQKDWDPVELGTSEGLGSSRTGRSVMTGTQSTSHDWNWCIPTSRVFETRIFLSSNFKKMRKYRFYWWSYFVYLFMIEVLNDFGLLKRIYVFWSKGDPVTQSGTGTGASLLTIELPTIEPCQLSSRQLSSRQLSPDSWALVNRLTVKIHYSVSCFSVNCRLLWGDVYWSFDS